MRQLFIIIVAVLLFQNSKSKASCDSTIVCNNGCCCKTNLTPSSVMLSHLHEKNKWMISYSVMNMNTNGLINGNKAIAEKEVYNNYLMLSDKMNMQMHMLMAMYGINNKLTVMSMFNYRINTMNMQMLPTINSSMINMHHSTISNETMMNKGLSDIQLYALYGLYKNEWNQIILIGGLNLPMGSINQKGNQDDMSYASSRLPYMMQLGSGTFDILPGLSYSIQKNKWASGLQWNNAIRFYNNSHNYHLGNESVLHLWGAYSWLNLISSSVHFEVNSTGKIKGKDAQLYEFNEPSAHTKNYGGRFMQTYIGSSFISKNKILSHFKISAEYGFQLFYYYNGIESPLKNSINTSISYTY